jgi:hypothetical protein
MPIIYCIAGAADLADFGFNYILSGICRDKYSEYIFSPLPINMCSFTTRRAYNFSNINSARAFCQKHRSVYVEIVIRLLTVINFINIKAGFFHRDVMPKGVFSIFKKDPLALLIYDLVIGYLLQLYI